MSSITSKDRNVPPNARVSENCYDVTVVMEGGVGRVDGPHLLMAHGDGDQVVWHDHDVAITGAPRRSLRHVARSSTNCLVI
eukprot:1072122-Amphidinium_carterae.1